MKSGAWYVAGFVIAFVYFYVYAVNYVRGEDVLAHANESPFAARQFAGLPWGRPQRRRQSPPSQGGPPPPLPLPARQAPPPPGPPPQAPQPVAAQPIYPQLSWSYHNYTSMTTYLRHVSTIYSNLTALYSIGQSVQGMTSYSSAAAALILLTSATLHAK